MTRAVAALLVLALLPGCKSQEDKKVELRSAYVDALCRIYAGDAQCVQNIQDSCGASITFDTEADCRFLFSYLMNTCTGAMDALYENKDTVQSCIDQLDGFDCANDQWCSGSTDFASTGACAQVDDIIQPLCPQDTGGF